MNLKSIVAGVATILALTTSGAAAADIAAALEAALAGAHRAPGHAARDVYRHPKETLMFFGLEPTMHVIEMLPGGEAWYTELLAPVLREQGKLITVTPPGDHPREYFRKSFADFNAKLDATPAVYDKVERRTMGEPPISLGEPASVDMVVTFRSTHNWIRGGQFESVYKAIFEVLKPGGVLGIEQHRAAEGGDVLKQANAGYVAERYLIDQLEALGFKFEGQSQVNANPRDTKNYAEGVWTLPPTLALGDKDREKYLAIGESDRMTLKFRKPAP